MYFPNFGELREQINYVLAQASPSLVKIPKPTFLSTEHCWWVALDDFYMLQFENRT